MSQIERLASARVSSNLSGTQVGVIIAAGITAHRRKNGGTLLHLSATKPGDIDTARREVLRLTRKLNLKRGWRLAGRSLLRVAEEAAMAHIAPACLVCSGIGFELAPGTTVKSDKRCSCCVGSGIRPLPRENESEIRYVLAELYRADEVTEATIRKLMR